MLKMDNTPDPTDLVTYLQNGKIIPIIGLEHVPLKPKTLYAVDIDGVLISYDRKAITGAVEWLKTASKIATIEVILITARKDPKYTRDELAKHDLTELVDYAALFCCGQNSKGIALMTWLNESHKEIVVIDDMTRHLHEYLDAVTVVPVTAYWVTKRVTVATREIYVDGKLARLDRGTRSSTLFWQ
jgi:hypothetical protein